MMNRKWVPALCIAVLAFGPEVAFGQMSACNEFVRYGMQQHLRQVSGSSNYSEMRTAITEALERSSQTGTTAGINVVVKGVRIGGSFTRSQLEAMREFMSSSSMSIQTAQQTAATASTYISPEAYQAARECWRLQSEQSLLTNLRWDENEMDEFTLDIAYRPIGNLNPSTPLHAVTANDPRSVSCNTEPRNTRRLTPTAVSIICTRKLGNETNARGDRVRATSTLVTVRTGVGNITVNLPEIPFGPPAADPLPIGTIIDWRMSDGDAVPMGWAICDGSVVDTPGSPLQGQPTPDLRGRFIVGGIPAEVGRVGGRADIPSEGAHNHGGLATDLTYRAGEINWPYGPAKRDPHSHGHSIGTDGGHAHGGENRPPFFTVVKLIKVLPTAGQPN
jgi:hypothetical protein